MNEIDESTPTQQPPVREPTFTNPYTLTKEATAECVTVACSISKHDYNFLKCIRPSWGTNASVIGLLWKKLCNELNKRNITDVSNVTEFEQFVLKCHIVGDEEYQQYANTTTKNNSGNNAEVREVRKDNPTKSRRAKKSDGSKPELEVQE